jgi:hypothetical protein
MEGALVRHPPPSLTRRRGERGPGGGGVVLVPRRGDTWRVGAAAPGCDRGRQRSRHELGSRPKKPRPGGAARRSYRSQLHQDRAAPLPHTSAGASAPHARRDGSWAMAEAGGSPSSDAPPGSVRWRSNDRRRAGAGRRGRPKGRKLPRACPEGAKALEGGPARDCRGVPQGSPRARARKGSGKGSRCARESDGPCWVHVVVSRLQKSERSIFFRARSACREALTRFEAGRASTGIV